MSNEDMDKLVIFDLDGTLCDIEHRRHLVTKPRGEWTAFYRACVLDQPKHAVLAVMRSMLRERHRIEIWSGRSELVREETVAWFSRHAPWALGIPLRMRPLKDNTPDDALKEQWLNAVGSGTAVKLVFDDRNKVVAMWRRRGIPCMQVAEGMF